MAWNAPHLRLEILQEFAGYTGHGWTVVEIPSPYDTDEPDLTIEQRVRRRREEFLKKCASVKAGK